MTKRLHRTTSFPRRRESSAFKSLGPRLRGGDVRNGVGRVLLLIRETLARAVGAPDYAAYLEHERTHHPERMPLAYGEFFRRRQAARYGGEGPPRCC